MHWILYIAIWSLFVIGSGYALMTAEEQDEDGRADGQDATRKHDSDPASRMAAGLKSLLGLLSPGQPAGPRPRGRATVLWDDPQGRPRPGTARPAA